EFNNALRIYLINTIINKYNFKHLEELQSLIFTIKATNKLDSAKDIKYINISN
ncbi:hypothetical protein GE21DRAFT_1177132, partial [Neurospora crassa]